MHVLQVLDSERLGLLHPAERRIVEGARRVGVSVHRCSCGMLITGSDASKVESNYRHHVAAVDAA